MLLNVSALLATLALVAAQAPPQTPPPPPAAAKPTGSISGRILEHDSREPVRGATVVAMRFGGSALSAVSDGDGRYRLEPAVPGMYLLRVEHERFVAMPTAGVVAGPGTTLVEVDDSAQVRDMNLVMARAAVIRGRVVGDAGAPLARTFVDADGVDTRLPSLINTQTNDRGEFELRLPPGRFFIRASDVPVLSTRPESARPSMGNSEYVATYYPGVSRKEEATAIAVSAGDAVPNVNISLLRRVSNRIGGRVTSDGVLVEGGRLSLVSSTGGLARMRTRADGSFGFVDLKPGRYVLWARPPAEDSDDVAWQALDLGEAAVDVELALAPGGRLRGGVVDEQGQPPPEGARVIAALLDDSREIDPTSPDQVEVDAGGAFDLAGLFGSRALRVIGLPAGWDVKAILVNGRESPKAFKIVEGKVIDGVSIVIAPR